MPKARAAQKLPQIATRRLYDRTIVIAFQNSNGLKSRVGSFFLSLALRLPSSLLFLYF